MKRILLILIIVLSGYCSYAQWTGTSPIYTLSGNVGIGTAATDLFEYGNYAGSTHSNKFITAGSNTFTGFEHSPNIAAINFAVINSLGSPDIMSKIMSIATGTSNNAESGDLAFYTKPNTVSTAALERMRISSSGNVGIGTTSPASSLHVIGNTIFEPQNHDEGLIIAGKSGAVNQRFDVQLSKGNGAYSFYRIAFAGNNIFSWGESLSQFANNMTINNPSEGFLTLGTNNTERIRISTSGNIGIGTTSPDEKLTVKGKIHSQEVIVDAMTTVPDYVFESNYKLPSLSDIKSYVDKNHHLPEIPSANEIEKSGIQLGDMNMKLLKKIEELTLYLIEKDKKDKEKDTQLQSQQDQINQLKEQVATLIKVKN